MSTLPKNLYRADQVRELDRVTIEEFDVPGMTLMEHAGSAAFNALHSRWPRATRIAVVCGTGNNGGDGYVVARMADAAGLRAVVYQIGDKNRLSGDALTAYERLEGTHVNILNYDAHSFEMFDVVVDAMLGTGLQGDVSGVWQTAINSINQVKSHSRAILAIDVPSGLHADTGRILGCAVRADLTVTFIGMKQGLLTGNGPDCCGEIIFNDLDIPKRVYASVQESAQRIQTEDFPSVLAPRRASTYKNQCGHVMVIGGNHGFAGAVVMAAEAVARSGAGLITVATRPEFASVININRPELMCRGINSNLDLVPLFDNVNVIAIGPGLGSDDWAKSLFSFVLECNLPMVLDADALNLLASQPVQRDNWILTPHPGEAARLLGCTTHDIQSDRFYAVQEIRKRFGGICVLKGCGTLVSHRDKEISVCDAGNPGMASGGMGDVLTGVIAGLVAQGNAIADAAQCGVCVHAAAADVAAQAGQRGMLARDLMPHIRNLVNPG